jgi:uncharacterized membrane protein
MQEFFANDIVRTFLIAMAPIGELRVSLPLALTKFNMSLPLAFTISVLGNMFPIIFIVYFLEPVSIFLSKHSKFFNWFFKWLFQYTRKKHSKKFEVMEEIALVTFVAIPLPMTGAWSGALAAFVFGIPPKKALPLLALGVIGAGVIVTIVTLGLKAII